MTNKQLLIIQSSRDKNLSITNKQFLIIQLSRDKNLWITNEPIIQLRRQELMNYKWTITYNTIIDRQELIELQVNNYSQYNYMYMYVN